jgi:lipopolysaccharide heptosyltransferase II
VTSAQRILLFQTAFIGDVILMLPLAQALRRTFPDAWIAAVAIPASAGVLANHPAINEVLVFDKRGAHRGYHGIRSMAGTLRAKAFEVALIPHRSLRSALVCSHAGIPRRVGFDRSAGRFLLTERVRYDAGAHEITRDLALAAPLGVTPETRELPSLYPGASDVALVDALLQDWRRRGGSGGKFVAVAPGSVWNTKRWPAERFTAVIGGLASRGCSVVLLGGREDAPLCSEISRTVGEKNVLNAAGRLSLLQSAELIRRCSVTLSNDSAPMHMAVAMRVPVVAIFGATVPAFGFAPTGPNDVVLETLGLSCRPCGIHGGKRCPVGTFECMLAIEPDRVLDRILTRLDNRRGWN